MVQLDKWKTKWVEVPEKILKTKEQDAYLNHNIEKGDLSVKI